MQQMVDVSIGHGSMASGMEVVQISYGLVFAGGRVKLSASPSGVREQPPHLEVDRQRLASKLIDMEAT